MCSCCRRLCAHEESRLRTATPIKMHLSEDTVDDLLGEATFPLFLHDRNFSVFPYESVSSTPAALSMSYGERSFAVSSCSKDLQC